VTAGIAGAAIDAKELGRVATSLNQVQNTYQAAVAKQLRYPLPTYWQDWKARSEKEGRCG
jgi:hypothetical protein